MHSIVSHEGILQLPSLIVYKYMPQLIVCKYISQLVRVSSLTTMWDPGITLLSSGLGTEVFTTEP